MTRSVRPEGFEIGCLEPVEIKNTIMYVRKILYNIIVNIN
jgi:hypothetical protein